MQSVLHKPKRQRVGFYFNQSQGLYCKIYYFNSMQGHVFVVLSNSDDDK